MNIIQCHCLLLFLTIFFLRIKCNNIAKSVSFITDYVKWRKINFLIFLDKAENSAYNVKVAKENLNIFVLKNIYFATHTSVVYSEATLNRTKEKTAIVTFLETNFSCQDFLDQANRISRYGEKAAWLIIANCHFQLNIMEVLRRANFGLNSDIVVAVDSRFSKPSKQNDTTNTTDWETLFTKQESFLPFQYTGNQTSNCTNACDERNDSTNHNQDSFSLYQVYKIRKNVNTSLVTHTLGIWDVINSTRNLKQFWDYDNRRDLHKFPIVYGILDPAAEDTLKEADIDSTKTHFANYFSMFLNSSKIFIPFSKIGHRENGEWTDLLEAVINEDIDLSAEGIPKALDRLFEMTFSFTIVRNTKNIYIEPEKSEKMRDIFLVPFDSRLIFCVVGTGLILSVVITFNNFIDSRFCSKDIKTKNKDFSESVVWCIGIFSQQGSIWKTSSYPEKIIVLISLMFTVLIYNSYSAFITSVLSVELSSIRSVKDLLESDYTIGYAKDSQDEDYLRSVNSSELKQIYLRGYLQNEIGNISEGLLKVIKGNYGFFASGQAARMELYNMTHCKCKFDIDEIKIHYTAENTGIVMSKRSGYKRLINLSLIKMYETGIYKYVYSIIYPNLLKCEKTKTFQSARLADLSTAFFLLLFGWGASLTIMISECLWKKRNQIYKNLKKRWTNENEFSGIRGDYALNQFNIHMPQKSTLILPPANRRGFEFVN